MISFFEKLKQTFNLANWLFPGYTEQPESQMVITKIGVKLGMEQQDAQVEAYFNAKVRENLVAEEGYIPTAYKDKRGFPTVGIGHLITPLDNIKLGETISEARINQLFQKDVSNAIVAARAQAKILGKDNNTNFVIALVSVNFQLGTGWYKKFPNTWRLLKSEDWQQAIKNLKGSDWAQQTPNRVDNFINAIQESYA